MIILFYAWLYLVFSAALMLAVKIVARAKGWECRPVFAWYDAWLGFFWDRKGWKLYFFPVPMLGVVVTTRTPKRVIHAGHTINVLDAEGFTRALEAGDSRVSAHIRNRAA